MLIKKIYLFVILFFIFLMLSFFSLNFDTTAAPQSAYTPEPEIAVKMWELNVQGGRTGYLCDSSSTAWGCTAFCDSVDDNGVRFAACQASLTAGVKVYPFSNNDTPEIEMQTEYLPNVVAQERGIDYEPSALKALAVVARSYIWWYKENAASSINNSTERQAYIPYKFDSLNLNLTPQNPSVPHDLCDREGLSADQNEICRAVAPQYYLSPSDLDIPVRANHSADMKGRTTNVPTPEPTTVVGYLVGVDDPISNACDADDATANLFGFSQEGANRWARGHECSYAGADAVGNNDAGDEWSVSWLHFEQILFHYFTNVHLRDADNNNALLSPDNRWNPLKVNWGSGVDPNNLSIGTTYYPQIQIQNTGVSTWDSSVKLGCRLTKSDGTTISCLDVTMGAIAPGATVAKTLSVPIAAGSPKGVYNLKIDLKNASGWFREQSIPWHSLDYKLCVGSDSCSENYLPLVMKNYRPPFVFNLPFNSSTDLNWFAPHPGTPSPVSTNGTVNPATILPASRVSNDGHLTPNGAMKLHHNWMSGSGEGYADWTFDVQDQFGALRAGDVDFSLSARAGGGWGRDRSRIYVFFTDGTYVRSTWAMGDVWVQRWIKRNGESGFDVTGNNPASDGWGPYKNKYLDRIVLRLTFSSNASDFYIDDFELSYQP